MPANKTKFISEVNIAEAEVHGRRPFRVNREDNRRYVRLEISAIMSVIRLKDIFGNYQPRLDAPKMTGSILNISSGGVLVDLNQPLNEGDVVVMDFTLQDVEKVENVLGEVKRCEPDEDGAMIGIAFVNRDYLQDRFSAGELEMLSEHLTDFTESIQNVLGRYLYSETAETR